MKKFYGFFVLFVGTIFSKAAGFFREILFSAYFGTGETATAFKIAQTAYLLPVQALVGDTLSAGLLPLYNKLEFSQNRQKILILSATIYALILSLLLSFLIFTFSKSIVIFIAPGSSVSVLDLASSLLCVLSLSLPFYILGGTLSFIETAYGFYSGIAFRPILINIFSILGILLTVYFGYEFFLALLILLAHFLFLIITIYKLCKIGNILSFKNIELNILKEVFLSFIKNMYPLLGLPIIVQASVICERIISSKLGVGVIPSVDYARILCETLVQLIAVPLGIITMSQFGGKSILGIMEFSKTIIKILIFLITPISLFFYQNSFHIIKFIYGRGAFNDESISLTSTVFQWMGLALVATVISYFLIKTLNAMLENKAALFITLVAVIFSILINFTFWNMIGIHAIGISVLSYSVVILLMSSIYLKISRYVLSCFIMIFPLIIFQYFFNKWFMEIFSGNIIIFCLILFIFWCLFYFMDPLMRGLFFNFLKNNKRYFLKK